MRKSLALLGVAAAAVVLATPAFAENRGVSFTGTGFIAGPTCVGGPNAGLPCTVNANCPSSSCRQPASSVWDVNYDGTVFLASPSPFGNVAAYWTPDGGWGQIIGAATPFYISNSGDTVMGNGVFPGSSPAFVWPGVYTGVTDVWDPIPNDANYSPCGSSRLSLTGFSGEGDYATGLTWQGCTVAQGFLYDKSTDTTIALGRKYNRSTRGNSVPADGSKVIGWGTMTEGLRRGATWQNGEWTFLGDPNGEEPKACVTSGGFCTSNTASATTGCPEFVDDGTCANRGTCQNRGTCTSNVCVGGINAGNSCTNNNQCPGACAGGTNPGTSCTNDNVCAGTCTGPSAGTTCTSAGACPDTLVCAPNPDFTSNLFKGEAYDVTPDGRYASGRNFLYPLTSAEFDAFDSGYRANLVDGTFTKLEKLETWPYLVDPFRISDNGKVIVGRAGTQLTGTAPYLWIEGVGSIDLQLFLISQGLDELHFWLLLQASAVSGDGTTIGGYGANPDGRLEGWVADISKMWVCHVPGDNPDGARTLGIDMESAADHVAHGDFLGTCEFMNSGALSRAVETREALSLQYKDMFRPALQMNEASSTMDMPKVKLDVTPADAHRQNGARPKGGRD